MQLPRPLLPFSSLTWVIAVAVLAIASPRPAKSEALLLVEAESGKVLEARDATMPWHPASLSKLMTAYVTLKAVKEGRISLDTLLTVSPVAASQSPSKMGFRPGTQLTVDNALKMMLVKSANDMAVVLAEGVGGSIDGFSALMNENAQRLGMTQTNYVNPNGLPADAQVTSARDLAILARAIIHDLPEYEYFVHIPSIRFGRRITQNFNKLIGRYPGADGFKTGFVCASGYNLVGSATRDGRRLIAVVLGASSGKMRAVRAAQLLDRGFAANPLSFLHPALGIVDNLPPVDAPPPDLHEEMCGGKHHPASDADEDAIAGNAGASNSGDAAATFFAATAQPSTPNIVELMAGAPAPSEPIVVYTGPTRSGAALVAAVAADTASQATPRSKGKKTRVATRKPEASADAKPDAKSNDAKSSDAKSGDVKPEAKPVRRASAKSDKPADTAATDKPAAAAKPAKPKAASKPAPKTTSGDNKPAS